MSSRTGSSKNKAIVRYNTGDTGDVDSAGPSTSAGQSGKRRKQATDANDANTSLNDEDMDRIISDCVKYLIITDKKVPIRRTDIIKAVAKQTLNRKTVEEIITEVKSQLLSTFGIGLVECPEGSGGLSYILVNKLPVDGLKQAINKRVLHERQLMQSSLMSAVLSIIFMNGGSVHEDIVWKFLTRLRFDVNPKSKQLLTFDESNGITVRKLVTEVWVRQLYVKYLKIEKSDPIAHEFQWGFRADNEFSKMDVLKFVCQMFNDNSQPQFWRTQYEEALKDMPIDENVRPEEIEVME